MGTSTNITYLNTAACGLVEAQSRKAGDDFTAELATNGSARSEQWRMEDDERIRTTIATFFGAQPHNIAIIPNFSWALNAIVHSLDPKAKVMLYKGDYPSVLEPFRINGFNIHWVGDTDGFTLPVDEITHAIQSKAIDVLAISHVQFNSGYKLDIAAIGTLCRQHGVLFIADATQSMGAIPFNLAAMDIDVLIGSNYKWMNAGFGTGILYMSNHFLERHISAVGGHNSYQMKNGVWQYVPSVKSYEPGHPNIYGQLVLEAAINQKLQTGVDRIETHNMRLTALLLAGLKDIPVTLVGPYTTDNRASFILLKDENKLSALLKEHNIIVTVRNGLVRISMHYYNTSDDIALLIKVLKNKYRKL